MARLGSRLGTCDDNHCSWQLGADPGSFLTCMCVGLMFRPDAFFVGTSAGESSLYQSLDQLVAPWESILVENLTGVLA